MPKTLEFGSGGPHFKRNAIALTSDENETLNLIPNNTGARDRLKSQIVVSAEWYRNLLALLASLRLMARGDYYTNGQRLPENLHLEALMREFCFWDDATDKSITELLK